jgi:hypothetical protein
MDQITKHASWLQMRLVRGTKIALPTEADAPGNPPFPSSVHVIGIHLYCFLWGRQLRDICSLLFKLHSGLSFLSSMYIIEQ